MGLGKNKTANYVLSQGPQFLLHIHLFVVVVGFFFFSAEPAQKVVAKSIPAKYKTV